MRRYGAMLEELERRLAAEPGVAGIAVAERLPRMDQPRRVIEMDGGDATLTAAAAELAASTPEAEHTVPGQFLVNTTAVAPAFFALFDAPILAGRGFDPGDLTEGARAVVVNQSFVDRVLGGRSPVGRRVRYVAPEDQAPGSWYEIVGVVGNLVRDRRSALVLDEDIRAHLRVEPMVALSADA